MIRLDHQQLGVQPGLIEMPIGGGITDIGGGVRRQEVTGVVVRLVARQGEQTDQGDRDSHRENWCGPTDNGRTDPTPSPGLQLPLGVQQLEEGSDRQHRRAQSQRREDRDQHSDGTGDTQ